MLLLCLHPFLPCCCSDGPSWGDSGGTCSLQCHPSLVSRATVLVTSQTPIQPLAYQWEGSLDRGHFWLSFPWCYQFLQNSLPSSSSVPSSFPRLPHPLLPWHPSTSTGCFFNTSSLWGCPWSFMQLTQISQTMSLRWLQQHLHGNLGASTLSGQQWQPLSMPLWGKSYRKTMGSLTGANPSRGVHMILRKCRCESGGTRASSIE